MVLVKLSDRQEDFFVDKSSIVREIWGKGDTILFIFAGAAAEFALSKAVDWLYFTGRLPAEPIGRLFSTVAYARTIVFSEKEVTVQAIDAMNAIHAKVETTRGMTIPDWAYRDVLFMLIDYSIRAYEVLERDLSEAEKNEVFEVFKRVGDLMHLKDLPATHELWKEMRQSHLQQHLEYSAYTSDLLNQYRKHLGTVQYTILIEVQLLVLPQTVREKLAFRKKSFLFPLLAFYKVSKIVRLDSLLKTFLFPKKYRNEIQALDVT